MIPDSLPAFEGFDVAHRVLAACAIFDASQGCSPPGIAQGVKLADGAALLAAATAHQLRPQLCAHLEAHRASLGDAADVLLRLRPIASAHEGHGLMLAGELRRVVEVLGSREVTAIPFKGPAFASLVGHGPRLREMGDLDLFVEFSLVGKAVNALRELGYESPLRARALDTPWLALATDELLLTRRADGGAIELHWRLGHRWFPACVTLADIGSATRVASVFGVTVQWPKPEELLLVHVTDGLKAGGASLRWAADVATLLLRYAMQLDWTRLCRIAQANGGLRGLRASLLVAARVSREAGRVTGVDPLASALPAAGRELLQSRDAGCMRAAADMLQRMARDAQLQGPLAQFRWALQVADRPARVASQVAAYLAGPALADLMLMPETGESDACLRWRALRRRAAR
ncbi:MAG: nucleotidyltransferase family protein [Pseudomonadota bacterium]|nr:nucleotidyltransferase family protein [Pseudomonadota bacterium]